MEAEEALAKNRLRGSLELEFPQIKKCMTMQQKQLPLPFQLCGVSLTNWLLIDKCIQQ